MPATSSTALGYYWCTAFLSGAGVLVLELSATRALAPYFGQALFVWTNVIGLVLLGLALGATVGGRFADRHPHPGVLGAVLLVAAALVASAAFSPSAVARAIIPEPLPLEAAQPFMARGSFVTTLICFVPPVFVLGAVSPFLVRCATDDLSQVGSRAGLLSGAATMGSIAGTFLTSYVLLPELGTRGSILLAAGVLAASSLPLWWSARRPVGVGAATLLSAGLLYSAASPTLQAAEEGVASGELIAAFDSQYQHIEIRRRAGIGLVLALDEGHDSYQSVLPPQGVWTGGYYDAHTLLASQAGSPDRLHVLICGLAGGTHARQLLHAYGDREDLRIVGVEIDPLVVEVAREYLDFPNDERLKVFSGVDARTYVEHARQSFDLILVDCYSQQSFVPFHLASREFFRAAERRLHDGGILAANVSAYGGQDPVLSALANTIAEVFGSAVVARIPDCANFLLYAGKQRSPPLPRDFDPARVVPDWEIQHLLERMQSPVASWVHHFDPKSLVLDDERTALDWIQIHRMAKRAALALRSPP